MQQGFCPAASLCEVTVHHTFGNRGGAVGCGVRCVQNGRRALPQGRSSLSWVGNRGVTLFSCSGVQLHLSTATPALAPLLLPSSTAQPDFPRCPFRLC